MVSGYKISSDWNDMDFSVIRMRLFLPRLGPKEYHWKP